MSLFSDIITLGMLGIHLKKLKITCLLACDFQLFLMFSQHPVCLYQRTET